MDLALQLLFTGIGIGAVYALVALGFVLIFRATNVVNFAQGEFSMVAAYLMVVFAVDLGWPYWLSVLLALLGISVSTMIMITFIYSAVLGGLAGILVAPILFVSIQMGSTIALKAFAATIIGGFGDVAGAIIGGLALGIIETFGAAYISVPYKDGFAFLVLVLFLIFRPQGIFGERVAEKA